MDYGAIFIISHLLTPYTSLDSYSSDSEHIYSSSYPESIHAALRPIHNRPYAPHHRIGLVLNIQMQCCDTDLAQKMKQRDKIKPEENKSIMRQLLAGLEYLHLKNIIHRDIKPSNLFFVQDMLQIGDVGLSRYHDMAEPDNNKTSNGNNNAIIDLDQIGFSNELTNSVGTALYSAPEQKSGNSYKCSADVYSCGVVMFELYNLFSTSMERVDMLQGLRSSGCSNEFTETWPDVSKIIHDMIKSDPNTRPSAADLRKNSFFGDTENSNSNDKKRIKEQSVQIERLKKKLEEERSLNRQLRETLGHCRCQPIEVIR